MRRAVLILLSVCSVATSTVLPFPPIKAQYPVTDLFVDFDGTIAVTEAFETLAGAAYDSVPKEKQDYPPWSYFGDVYNTEYDAFAQSFGSRTNLSEEIAFRSARGLHKVESDSYERVNAAGVFKGVKSSVLTKAAQAVELRDGWWEFVEWSLQRGVRPRIVSLNWSVVWIRLVLRESIKKRGKKWKNKQWLAEEVEIYCSEIVPRGVVPSNKYDRPTRLHTGGDKVDFIRKKTGGRTKGVMFVGDSTSDLPPLYIPSDIGIISAGDDGLLARLQSYGIGVEILPVVSGKDQAGIMDSSTFSTTSRTSRKAASSDLEDVLTVIETKEVV